MSVDALRLPDTDADIGGICMLSSVGAEAVVALRYLTLGFVGRVTVNKC